MKLNKVISLLLSIIAVFLLSNCSSEEKDEGINRKLYDAKKSIYEVSPDTYKNSKLFKTVKRRSLERLSGPTLVQLFPLGIKNDSLFFEYIHEYPSECFYKPKFSQKEKLTPISFPNGCKDTEIKSLVYIKNLSDTIRTYYVRTMYQNVSFVEKIQYKNAKSIERSLNNYYGCSKLKTLSIPAKTDTFVEIPLHIGPSNEFYFSSEETNPRSGNYEFIAIVKEEKDDNLLSETINLEEINPFSYIYQEQYSETVSNYFYDLVYCHPEHFQFTILSEELDKAGNINDKGLYAKQVDKNITSFNIDHIKDGWTFKDTSYPMIEIPFGYQSKNVSFKSNQCILTIPGSKDEKQKTWGLLEFGPKFKYGNIKVKAKFAPVLHPNRFPTGIINTIELTDANGQIKIKKDHPFHHLSEIHDEPFGMTFSIAPCYDKDQQWNGYIKVISSLTDYMNNPKALLQPGDSLKYYGEKYERFQEIKINIAKTYPHDDLLKDFHIYEINWSPQGVRFKIDGQEMGLFNNEIGSLPNIPLTLSVSSKYDQKHQDYPMEKIPLLEKDQQTIIDWIQIN